MEQNKFEIVLKLLIGNRSINQTARESGVAKANISRLLTEEHFIYLKYRKDGSVHTGSDNFKFRIRFESE